MLCIRPPEGLQLNVELLLSDLISLQLFISVSISQYLLNLSSVNVPFFFFFFFYIERNCGGHGTGDCQNICRCCEMV